MEIKVQKKFIRTSPDKIRQIINLIRGWKIDKAVVELRFLNKRAAKPVLEILKSSVAAVKDQDAELNELYIKSIICNEGPRLKRRRVIHKGRATAINKRMSHIILVVSDEGKKLATSKTVGKDIKKEKVKAKLSKE